MPENNDKPVARSDQPADNTNLSQHPTNQDSYREASRTFSNDNERKQNAASNILPEVEIGDSSKEKPRAGSASSDSVANGGIPVRDSGIEGDTIRGRGDGSDAARERGVAKLQNIVNQGLDIKLQSSILYHDNPTSTGQAGYDSLSGKVAMVTDHTTYTTVDGHKATAQPGQFMIGAQQKNGEFAFRALTQDQLNSATRMTEIKVDTTRAQTTWFRGAPAEIVNRDISGRYLVSTGEANETVPMTPERERIVNETAKPIVSPEKGGMRDLFADQSGNVFRRGANGLEQLKNRHLVPPSELLKGQDFTAGRQVPVDGQMKTIKDVASDPNGGKLAIVPTGSKQDFSGAKTELIVPFDKNCVRLTSPDLKHSVVDPSNGNVYNLIYKTDGQPTGMSLRTDVVGKTESQTANEWQDLRNRIVEMDTAEFEIPKEILESVKPKGPEKYELKIGDKSCVLEPGKELTIGRKAGSDITMHRPSVSGVHGKFYMNESGQPVFENLSMQTELGAGSWFKENGKSELTNMKRGDKVLLNNIQELHIGGVEKEGKHLVSCRTVEPSGSKASPHAASDRRSPASGERKPSTSEAHAPAKPFNPLERQSRPKEVPSSHIKEVGVLPDGRVVKLNESIANDPNVARLENGIFKADYAPDPEKFSNITKALPKMAGSDTEYFLKKETGEIFQLTRDRNSSSWGSMPELTVDAYRPTRSDASPKNDTRSSDQLVENARAAIRSAEAGQARDAAPIQEVKVENFNRECGEWQKALVKSRNETSDPKERDALDRYIGTLDDMKAGRGNVSPEMVMNHLREGRAADRAAVDPIVARERSPLAGKVAIGAGVVVTVGALIGTYMALRNSMQGNNPEKHQTQKPARPSAALNR